MAKDYKHVSESRLKSKTTKGKTQIAKSSNKSLPGWLWMVSGLVIGSFVSFLVFLKMNVEVAETETKQTVKQPVVKSTPEVKPRVQEKASEPEKDRFEFYSILPEREVSVPANKTDSVDQSAEKSDNKSNTSNKAREGVKYLLQAGSFNRFKDADKRKATLALMGVTSKIYVVEKDANKTLYRVRIGPYDDISRINEIEAILKQNKIQSLLLQVRG